MVELKTRDSTVSVAVVTGVLAPMFQTDPGLDRCDTRRVVVFFATRVGSGPRKSEAWQFGRPGTWHC